MARVIIANLSKVFKVSAQTEIHAVRDLNLVVEDKEFMVLVGPSGSGKSTLLRLVAGLEEATNGSISIGDRQVNGVLPQDRDVAMVFQNFALYPHMTVYENMALGLKLRKTPKGEIDRCVRDCADLLEISPCLDRYPKTLSGGQRQRVALGRAIVRKPKVLLLDEPLSNLDAPMRVHLRLELVKLHARLATTILYVTHDQAEALALGRRVAVMRDGTFQQIADPLTLYRRPVNLFVAGFIGSPPMNFLKGTLVSEDGALWFHELSLTRDTESAPLRNIRVCLPESWISKSDRLKGFIGKEIILGIRPEDIVQPESGQPCPDNRQTIEATIDIVEFFGAETHVYFRTASHRFAGRFRGWHEAKADERVTFRFDMRHAHLFDPITGAVLSENSLEDGQRSFTRP
jgi:multiple sugar transport system ATP-binding protein